MGPVLVCYVSAVTEAARKRATYEDVLAAPRHVVAEIVRGTLHTHPRPAVPHARAQGRLHGELGGPFDLGRGGPGGWILLLEPELHLGEDIVVPDIAGWRREGFSVERNVAFISAAPQWICEVVSPSTEALDRSDKMDIYARESVRHAWLLDPIDQVLEVFRLESSRWVRLGAWRAAAKVRAEPFDSFELDLSVLWQL